MKFTKAIICCIFFSQLLFAQDKVILKSGDEFNAKIIKIGLDMVKYKKWTNLEGPIYSVSKSDIFKITYQNGEHERFKDSNPNQYATNNPSLPNSTSSTVPSNMPSGANQSGDPKNFKAPNNKALVYIVRPGWFGGTIGLKLFVNGKEFGKNTGVRYMYGFFKPGTYTFMSKGSNKSEVRLTVKAGQTYFLYQEALVGLGIKPRNRLTQMNQEVGRINLASCKQSQKQMSPHFN